MTPPRRPLPNSLALALLACGAAFSTFSATPASADLRQPQTTHTLTTAAGHLPDANYRGLTSQGFKVAIALRKDTIHGFYFFWKSRCSDGEVHIVKSLVRRPFAIHPGDDGRFDTTVVGPNGSRSRLVGRIGRRSASGSLSRSGPVSHRRFDRCSIQGLNWMATRTRVLTSPATGSTAAPIQTPQPEQRHHFAIFRSPAEGLPPAIRKVICGRSCAARGYNPTLAQRTYPNPYQKPIWALPRAGEICIYARSNHETRDSAGAYTCAPTPRVIHSGLGLYTLGSAHGPHTYALLPDDVTEVRIKDNPHLVPVFGNAVSAPGEGIVRLIRDPQASPSADVATPIQAPQPEQRHHFAIFRTAPERMPAAVRRTICAHNCAARGFNFALAQQARPNPAQKPIWAIPLAGWICIYAKPLYGDAGGRACARTPRVIHHGLALVTARAWTPATGPHVYALLPDGVTEVRIKDNPHPITVRGNAVSAPGKGIVKLIRTTQPEAAA